MFKTLVQYFLVDKERNHKHVSYDNWCPGRDSKLELPITRCNRVVAYLAYPPLLFWKHKIFTLLA